MRRRLFGLVAALFVLVCAGTVGLIVIGVRHARDESKALRTIADNGAAASKPMPTAVTVFIPETGGAEKMFGDEQLLAILPALPHVDDFDALDLHGSSVTDAGIGQLRKLTQLEALDVSDTPVTIKGLLALQGLPRLRQISIAPDQLSHQDLQRLNAAFPNVILIWHRVAPQTQDTGT